MEFLIALEKLAPVALASPVLVIGLALLGLAALAALITS